MATLNPYIHFSGNAAEALAFYQSALGGEVTTMPYSSMAHSMPPEHMPDNPDLVMHGQLTLPDGLVLMAADTPPSMGYEAPNGGMTVTLSGEAGDLDRLRGAYDKLSEGGKAEMPFDTAPWGDWYGQFTDKFGVGWMVNVAGS